jgi:excisionase family DNA binding protein
MKSESVKEMPEDEKLLTFKEALTYLGISRNTLYKFIFEGRLKAHKVGVRWRFYLGDLRSFVSRQEVREQARDRSEQY